MERELNMLDFVIALAKHKLFIIVNFIAISVIALIIALVLPWTYKSSFVFIPKSSTSTGLQSLLVGSEGISLGTADLLGGYFLSKRQVKELLYSKELRIDLINKFDLVKVYEKEDTPNPIEQCLRKLEENIQIEEKEEGGLGVTNVIAVSVTVFGKDPQRTADMAGYLYELLKQKIFELNSNEYVEISEFISQRVEKYAYKLDSIRKKLKTFQIKHHTYNVDKQVEMVLETYAEVKSKIVSIENQINYLTRIHSSNYSEIKALSQRKKALEEKLKEMEYKKKRDVFVGLTSSIELSFQLADLMAKEKTYDKIRVMLQQQLEQARIKQKKNFAPLYLVDAPRVPEYKCKPKRSVIVLLIVGIYMFILLIGVLIWEHYTFLRSNQPERLNRVKKLIHYLTSFK